MGINVTLVETLFPVVLVDILLSSHPACKDEGKEGEGVCCEDHIGVGKKLLRALRLMGLPPLFGGMERAASTSTVGQLPMSLMGRMITWMGRSAVWWPTMAGIDVEPVPTRPLTLLIGRRRDLPKLWGLQRMVIYIALFATRRRP